MKIGKENLKKIKIVLAVSAAVAGIAFIVWCYNNPSHVEATNMKIRLKWNQLTH